MKTLSRYLISALLASVLASLMTGPASAKTELIVQSTTSTKNSGLYDHILPLLEKDTGIIARIVAVGTGAAINNAMNCDGDILLVHSRKREDNFVADGFAARRYDVMYNDYVIVGPSSDPAEIAGLTDASDAFSRIASSQSVFASRGDLSGTHGKETDIWAVAGIAPRNSSGQWYRETGSGMGATLNIAVGMAGYTLTDRATWTKFGNKADLKILVEGDKRLFNPYGVMLVSTEKCPSVKAEAGQAFIDWLLSDVGQRAISSYRVDGKQLFFANAQP